MIYMGCKFRRVQVSILELKIGDHIIVIPQISWFKYFGSFLQSDWKIDDDVTYSIQAMPTKCRNDVGVICKSKMPIEHPKENSIKQL